MKGEVYYTSRMCLHEASCARRGCKQRLKWYQFPDDPWEAEVENLGWSIIDRRCYCQRHGDAP